jgi:FkbM family methyltransferase
VVRGIRFCFAVGALPWQDWSALNVIEKFWNYPPRVWLAGVKRRLGGPTPEPAKPRWVKVTGGALAGREILIAPERSVSWGELAAGTFDASMYRALEGMPLAGATFWDIGAHFGYHSLAFAVLAGELGRVVAFEPNPFNQDRFKLHLERNPELARRIDLQTVALSASDGETTFTFSPEIDDGMSSCSFINDARPPREAEAYAGFRQERVKTMTIDTFFAGRKGPAPTVIKIDVEGAEGLVLRGARKFFADHRPVILMEVHNIRLMHEVQGFLSAFGYRTELIDEEHTSLSRCFIVARS